MKIYKLFILIYIMFIMCSCTNSIVNLKENYVNSRNATIEAWEEVINKVSDKCYNRSINATVVESKYFPTSCIPPNELIDGKTYVGCYFFITNTIFILESRTELQKEKTAVHEYIHLLSTCELKNIDFLHLDKRLWDDYGPNTVEAIGCFNLNK